MPTMSTCRLLSLLFQLLRWTLSVGWCCAAVLVVFDGAGAVRSQSLDASVRLNQGIVMGLKVFPETSRTSVYSYLGIPYAQPPIGQLRFAPPKAHNGWNRTLYARNYQAICPQPDLNVYEETPGGSGSYSHQSRTSENCLFLNIWTPENCLRQGHCATLAIITGEEQAFDWARHRPSGLDLAAEGLVVITIQSRTNILGWLTTGDSEAPGNLPLRDQHMALEWIAANIAHFGGRSDLVTLLGHGTSGATNAMIHMTSRRTSKLFQQLILMSGSVFSPWSYQVTRNAASTSLAVIRNLSCDSQTQSDAILRCLRERSVVDLMRAFENVHQNGNYTRLLAAEVDRYLPASERWIGEDPRTVIRVGSFKRMPIMMGICSNEGAFLRDQWLELGRESYAALDGYVRKTLVPNALEMMGFQDGGFNESLTRQLINWRFFEQIPKDVPSLLAAMQLFLSETRFERPFFETLELLIKPEKFNAISEARALVSSDRSAEDEVNVIVDAQQMSEFSADQDPMEHRMRSDTETDYAPNRRIPSLEPSKQVPSSAHPSLFAYTFQQSHSIDLRGRPNFFGGAAHTTDLLFLMGPNLYQQVGRRRLTVTEEKLCKRMRQTFSDFVKTGNPTPGRLFDAWLPYNANHRFIQPLGSADGIGSSNLGTASVTTGKRAGIDEITNRLSFVQQNRVQIAEMLNGDGGQPGVVVSSGGMAVNPYSIGQRKIDAGTMTSSRHSKSYLPGDPSDSAASIVMARASAFWTEVLPHVYEQQQLLSRHNAANVGQVATGSVVSADMASKFRHAFFAMLALVCVLLAMLGVCVYMLRKGHRRTIDTSYL